MNSQYKYFIGESAWHWNKKRRKEKSLTHSDHAHTKKQFSQGSDTRFFKWNKKKNERRDPAAIVFSSKGNTLAILHIHDSWLKHSLLISGPKGQMQLSA